MTRLPDSFCVDSFNTHRSVLALLRAYRDHRPSSAESIWPSRPELSQPATPCGRNTHRLLTNKVNIKTRRRRQNSVFALERNLDISSMPYRLSRCDCVNSPNVDPGSRRKLQNSRETANNITHAETDGTAGKACRQLLTCSAPSRRV
jgi:hypothetical protein